MCHQKDILFIANLPNPHMEEWPYMSTRNFTISVKMTLDSRKRIYLKQYGQRSNERKAKLSSVAVHTDILTQMWMNLRITLKKSFKKFPRKIN